MSYNGESQPSTSIDSSTPSPAPPVKKRKRAETKPCPACHEAIPIRLLAIHSELEMERVKDIMNSIGSTEVIMQEFEGGSISRDRRSAARARKSLSSKNTLEEIDRTIQLVRRHRKQRHIMMRDMTRDEEQGSKLDRANSNSDQMVCPVCSETIGGGQDEMEVHVDTCLAYHAGGAQENEGASQGDGWESIQVDGETRVRMTDSLNFRGMGFHVRDHDDLDVEDEVDVDGDDEAVFGRAQFTEGDVLCPGSDPQHPESEVRIDGDDDLEARPSEKSLHDLVSEGRIVKLAEGVKEGDEDTIDSAITGETHTNHQVIVLDNLNLPHLSRSVHRAYSINRMLAYLLQRMLVALSWIYETVPDLQAYYCCNRFEEDLFMINAVVMLSFESI